MKRILLLSFILLIFSCKNEEHKPKTDISDISSKQFREFKVEDSKFINVDIFWNPFYDEMKSFTEDDYNKLKPLIFDQDIPTIQSHILNKELTYEKLVKFYLYRIKKYDRANSLSLNSIIALNSNIISEAKAKDDELNNKDVSDNFKYSVFGIPILLKDNINTKEMPTTAGAVALLNNLTDDAFIVKRLKEEGALILGKARLPWQDPSQVAPPKRFIFYSAIRIIVKAIKNDIDHAIIWLKKWYSK